MERSAATGLVPAPGKVVDVGALAEQPATAATKNVPLATTAARDRYRANGHAALCGTALWGFSYGAASADVPNAASMAPSASSMAMLSTIPAPGSSPCTA